MICASSTGDSLIFGEVSYTLAIRCRPSSVQSLRPGVQMSAQDGSWTPVYRLPSLHLRSADCSHLDFPRLWNLLRTEDVHLHTPALRIGTHFHLLTIVFFFHLLSATPKPFCSFSTRLAHAVRFGFFYKNTLYKFTVIIIIITYASEYAESGLQTIWLQSIKHRRRSREGPQVRTLTIIWLWMSSMAWTLTIIWLHYRISSH